MVHNSCFPRFRSVLGVLGRGGKEDAWGQPGDPGRIFVLDFTILQELASLQHINGSHNPAAKAVSKVFHHGSQTVPGQRVLTPDGLGKLSNALSTPVPDTTARWRWPTTVKMQI